VLTPPRVEVVSALSLAGCNLDGDLPKERMPRFEPPTAAPRVAPFADLRDVGSLLQRAGFALPVTDVDRVVVRYDSAFALMQDLRRMGATNILFDRRRAPTRRATMLRMVQIYGERFADPDGRIRATFDIVWLSGWAPHESQPKPLRPGSAKASLEAAVKGTTKT